ncbi:MAG: hypothetical protein Q8M65_06405, partial [Rhodoglobus sp.]|nr:hypothetical protein [Rhodoglobus sp.]
MEVKSVRIVMSAHRRGEVFVNGEKVEHLVSFKVTAGVREMNQVTLTMHVPTIEILGEFEVLTAEHPHGA